MNSKTVTPDVDEVWAWVEGERRADLRLRKISFSAWVAMFVAVVVYCTFAVARLLRIALPYISEGMATRDLMLVFINGLTPVVIAIGAFSALAAAFSTVGVFLRLRTASLSEIQMRLASLEHLLTDETGEAR
jgi:hypothetical protein